MKPKIIMHTQISLDGRIKGFDNPEVYYQVAGGIHSDAVLFGSNTVFTAFEIGVLVFKSLFAIIISYSLANKRSFCYYNNTLLFNCQLINWNNYRIK